METWIKQYRGVILFALIILTVIGAVLFQLRQPAPAPISLQTATPSPLPPATPTPRPLRVYISGAVQQPDVYALPADSIIKDAMLAAGGPTEDADLDRINLAAALADGQHVYVPHLGETELPASLPCDCSGSSGGDGKVNINIADVAALDTLPGIGPVTAQRIIEYREANGPFARIEDIMNVSGIGQSTFAKIQDRITVGR
ncbi:MAG TPA: hypothetical protein ENJ31_03135 [Anaerolineae bacterium]|nr:hypothetical protein [Anaerolineae bacterium]